MAIPLGVCRTVLLSTNLADVKASMPDRITGRMNQVPFQIDCQSKNFIEMSSKPFSGFERLSVIFSF